MGKAKPCECEEGAPAWMVTFSDMTTLILTFFVLLVSMMVIDPKKFVEVLGVFQRTSGEGHDKPPTDPPTPSENFFVQIIRASTRRDDRPDGGLLEATEGEALRVFSFKDNYVVQLGDEPSFAPFDIALNARGKSRIDWVAENALKGSANKIKLVGHYSPEEADFENSPFYDEATFKKSGKRVRGIPRVEEYWDQSVGRLLHRIVTVEDAADLAARRARAVGEYLKSKGIPSVRLEIVEGRMISKVNAAEQIPAERWDPVAKRWQKETVAVKQGTQEASQLSAPAVEGIVLRNWEHFIFTEGGDDRGRQVEVVVTGELVGAQEHFAPSR